jgi:hypothetical protein
VSTDPRPHKDPPRPSPQPAVFARLNAEADVKLVRLKPHRAVRMFGWAIALTIAVFVVLAVFEASPW